MLGPYYRYTLNRHPKKERNKKLTAGGVLQLSRDKVNVDMKDVNDTLSLYDNRRPVVLVAWFGGMGQAQNVRKSPIFPGNFFEIYHKML